MKTRNRVEDSTPPCGMPCLRVLFLLVLFYLNFGFPVVHVLSKSICTFAKQHHISAVSIPDPFSTPC